MCKAEPKERVASGNCMLFRLALRVKPSGKTGEVGRSWAMEGLPPWGTVERL